jgi:hypothetical protein
MISFSLTRPKLGPEFSVSLISDDENLTPIELNWVDDADNQLIDDQNNTLIFLDYV